MHKDLKKIVKALDDQGFEVRTRKNGHIAVFKDGEYVTTFAGTPSSSRSWKNSVADCKRRGFVWPPP